MKVVVGLLLAVAVCSTVGLPAGDPKSETEYVTRNEDDFKDFAGVVDTGADLPSPFDRTDFGSADSFFSGISDFMRRFRERVFGDWWRSIPTLDIGNLDPSKGNSTSEVKVINGHRVEINNTVYTTNDESGNAIYKVRVVNVRPLNEDEDTTTAGPEDKTPEETDKKETKETKEREPLDNEVDNVFGATESTTIESHELPTTSTTVIQTTTLKSSSDEESGIAETTTPKSTEEFHNEDSAETTITESIEELHTADIAKTTTPKTIEEFHEDDFESVEAFGKPDKSEIASDEKFEKLEFQDSHSQLKPISSSEEAVPAIYAQHKAYFENNVPKYPYAKPLETEFSEEDVDGDITNPDFTSSNQGEWDSFENWHTNQDTNSVDDFQSVPVDLSNDIEVNQMLADQGAPTDPDAEVLTFNPSMFHYRPTSWVDQKYRPGGYWTNRRFIRAHEQRPIH